MSTEGTIRLVKAAGMWQAATAILEVANDPDRVRPKAEGGLATDYLNDFQWAAKIVSDLAREMEEAE